MLIFYPQLDFFEENSEKLLSIATCIFHHIRPSSNANSNVSQNYAKMVNLFNYRTN